MLLLMVVSYTNAQPAGSVPGSPSITASLVSNQVVLLTISERFDTTGCHELKRYSLQSTTDLDYQTITQPVRIGRHSFVKGLSPSDDPTIVFELYVIFAKPLKNSSLYHLQVADLTDTDGNAVNLDTTFIFSDASIQGNVKVNEVGYLPESPKLGKLGRFLGDAWFMPVDSLLPPAFQVISEDQQVAFNGTCTYLKSDSAFSGESVFEMDFSALETPGKYYVYVPGFGRSEAFIIGSDCYNTLYFNTARALYYQRSGNIEPAYGGEWAREGLPAETAQIHSSHLTSTLYSTSDFPPGTQLPMQGGWLDAGDYGRYVPTAASALFIMFTAFEIYPQKFPDNHLNIPESGNGVPDWLDEARYETDWLLQMQAPDGGVYFRVTPATWSQGLPGDEQNPLYISEKTTQSTALFAAAMAMAARNFKNFDAAYAALCLEKASNAWTFLKNHLAPTPPVSVPGISAGPYPDPIDADNRAWAAAELYKTTGEAQYHADFDEWYGQIPHQFHATMSWQQHTFKAAWAYATTTFAVNNTFVDEFKDKLTNEVLVNYFNRTMKIHAYHGAYHHFKGYVGYGSFGMAQSYAFDYIMFAHLLQKQELLDYAKIQLDIPLGNNPLSQCFITAAGVHSPKFPLHWSTIPGQYAQPVPGVPVFGPAASLLMNRPSSFIIQDSLNRYPYGYKKEDPYPVLRRYTDARQAVEMSEFTVQEIAVTAAVLAYFSSVLTDPLPVLLRDFTVKNENCTVRLHWSTSEEVNASHFSVYRSSDGKNFHEIGRVEASCTSNITRYYQFDDHFPGTSNYYRLRITDIDGTFENSAIRCTKTPCYNVQWAILPVETDTYKITIENPSDKRLTGYRGELYNILGQKIMQVLSADNMTFKTSRLPAGLYIMHLRNAVGEDLGGRKLLIF